MIENIYMDEIRYYLLNAFRKTFEVKLIKFESFFKIAI